MSWRTLSLALALVAASCGEEAERAADVPVPGRPGATKTSAADRAGRRAFDGAPPVVPHAPFGAACIACHNERGMDVPGVGFAPPSPHARTAGLSAVSNCTQCHVFRRTESVFVANTFDGLPQDLSPGARAYPGAPPVLPHRVFMRENCRACHSGPAAREEIRTSHPDRLHCRQCHVPQRDALAFER